MCREMRREPSRIEPIFHDASHAPLENSDDFEIRHPHPALSCPLRIIARNGSSNFLLGVHDFFFFCDPSRRLRLATGRRIVKENEGPTSSATTPGTNDPRLLACGTDEDVYPLRRRAHSDGHSACEHSAHRTNTITMDSAYGLQLPSSPNLTALSIMILADE